MDAVFAVADVITVMVNGQVLESGPPAQIRASAAVRDAYLGADARTSRASCDIAARRRCGVVAVAGERQRMSESLLEARGCTPTTARATSCTASTFASTPARPSA